MCRFNFALLSFGLMAAMTVQAATLEVQEKGVRGGQYVEHYEGTCDDPPLVSPHIQSKAREICGE